MPRFAYEALDSRGRVVQGEVDAPDAEAVVRDLRNIHYTVTNITERRDHFAGVKQFMQRFQRSSLYALAVFTRQFSVIFNSGVPTLRGLEGLGRQTLNARLSRAIQSVYKDVREGYSLAKAMSRHPDVFSPIYISMVRAGEMSGAMEDILERLASLLEREVALRKKVQAATTYPALVFLACVGVTFVLINYVFPVFASLFEGLNVQLPWTTRTLIWITETVRHPAFILLSLTSVGVGGYLAVQYIRTPVGRRHFDRLLLELPLLGPVQKKVALSRFCRTMGTLLASGVPMVHALDIVSRATGNEVVRDIIDEIQMGLKAGMRLSQPLKEYRIFPPMLAQMVSVGEETGNLPPMLNKLAEFYDMEVEHAAEQFTSLLEPLMIAFMGLIVGFILLAVFQPVYALMKEF